MASASSPFVPAARSFATASSILSLAKFSLCPAAVPALSSTSISMKNQSGDEGSSITSSGVSSSEYLLDRDPDLSILKATSGVILFGKFFLGILTFLEDPPELTDLLGLEKIR